MLSCVKIVGILFVTSVKLATSVAMVGLFVKSLYEPEKGTELITNEPVDKLDTPMICELDKSKLSPVGNSLILFWLSVSITSGILFAILII
jgi:hypothetical protein